MMTPETPETPPPPYDSAPLHEKGRLKGMKGRGVPDTPARKTAAKVGIAATVAANKKSPTEAKQPGGSGGRRKLGQPVKVDAVPQPVGLTPDSTHAHEDPSP